MGSVCCTVTPPASIQPPSVTLHSLHPTANMNRATKSGLAAETHAKVNSKYNEDAAGEVLYWIREVLGEDICADGSQDNFYEVLKDGQVLCRLMNKLKPGSIKKIQTSSMAFKCMENINNFSNGCKSCGLLDTELFQTVDLWERQNLNSVVICLQSLGRKGSNFGVAAIGPKESTKNVREFTDEQLKAGAAVTSLQYGSNKGASQTGMNFGNTRHM